MKQQYVPKNNKKKHKFGRGNGGYGALKPEKITALEITAIETPDVVLEEESNEEAVIENFDNAQNIDTISDFDTPKLGELENYDEAEQTEQEESSDEIEEETDEPADEINDEIEEMSDDEPADEIEETVYYAGRDDSADITKEDYSDAVYLNEDGETDFTAPEAVAEEESEPTEDYQAESEAETTEDETDAEIITEELEEPVIDDVEEACEETADEAIEQTESYKDELLDGEEIDEPTGDYQAESEVETTEDETEAEIITEELEEPEEESSAEPEESTQSAAEKETIVKEEEPEVSQDELIRLAVQRALKQRDEEELARREVLQKEEAEKREEAVKLAVSERERSEAERNRLMQEEAEKREQEAISRQKEFEEMMLSWKRELEKRDEEIRQMREKQALDEQKRQEEIRLKEELAEKQRREELEKQRELDERKRQEELLKQQEIENQRKQRELEDRQKQEEFLRQKEELIRLRDELEKQRELDERKRREEEQQRQEELRRRQELEEQQRQEELRRRQELEEQQRQEELRRRQELEEQQRQEELRRRQELEEQQRQEELRRRQELEEQQRQEELRRRQELEEQQRLEEQQKYNYSQDYEEEDYMNTQNVAKIKVVGVGGAGSNAVNRMIELGVDTAEFVAVNTDKQALMLSLCDDVNRIQIGAGITKGLGAGADPAVGEQSAEESKKSLEEVVKGVDLLFIAAGMGGGTGTGAAPIVAKTAKDAGCVTVAVVTRPFHFEGKKRETNAKKGISNLAKYVDTIIIIPNDRLLEALPPDTPFVDALKYADDTLRQGICGIADLIATPSLINLDFADVRTILKNQGLAHMGVGKAKGENRVIEAVRQAVSSPLLETTIEGAHGIILNVTGGKDLSMSQVKEAADRVQEIIDPTANIIFGMNVNPDLQEEIIITIIATGFDRKVDDETEQKPRPEFAFNVNRGQTLGQASGSSDKKAEPETSNPEYMNIRPSQRGEYGQFRSQRDTEAGRNEKPYEPTFPRRQEPINEHREEYNEPSYREDLPEETNLKPERKTDVPSFVKRLFGRK